MAFGLGGKVINKNVLKLYEAVGEVELIGLLTQGKTVLTSTEFASVVIQLLKSYPKKWSLDEYTAQYKDTRLIIWTGSGKIHIHQYKKEEALGWFWQRIQIRRLIKKLRKPKDQTVKLIAVSDFFPETPKAP